MLTVPTVVERGARPYVALRAELTMDAMKGTADRLFGELFAWLSERGLQPAGPPFIKYDRIDMAATLELEFGAPLAAATETSGAVLAGILPAGRYAVLSYQGDYEGLYDANAVLIGWAKEKGIRWDCEESDEGDRFACRLETYVTDPRKEPDPAKWQTEIAIKVR